MVKKIIILIVIVALAVLAYIYGMTDIFTTQ